MNSHLRFAIVPAAALLLTLLASRATAVSFVSLGDLPGGRFQSAAIGVSGDGHVVVGEGSSPQGREAFRWTAETGMIGLGDLPGG